MSIVIFSSFTEWHADLRRYPALGKDVRVTVIAEQAQSATELFLCLTAMRLRGDELLFMTEEVIFLLVPLNETPLEADDFVAQRAADMAQIHAVDILKGAGYRVGPGHYLVPTEAWTFRSSWPEIQESYAASCHALLTERALDPIETVQMAVIS